MENINTFEQEYSKYKLLIYKVANSFNLFNDYHRDELIQCGTIGLHLALSTYKENSGPFIPWLKIYLKKEMIKYLNCNLRTIRIPQHQLYNHTSFNPNYPTNISTLSLSTKLNEDSDSTILDTIITIDEEYTEKDTTLLKKAISTLKPQYKTIMEMVSEGEKIKTIAKHLNISTTAVTKQKSMALEKLKKIMIK